MNNKPKIQNFPKLLFAALAAAFVGVSASQAAIAIDSTSWAIGSGTPTNSLPTSTGLTWGNNTSNNASNTAVHAIIDGDTGTGGNQSFTLGIGETLTYSGTAELKGLASSATTAQFRFGIFNVNSSVNLNNWLGYIGANTTTTIGSGGITERANPNTSFYVSTTNSNGTLIRAATSAAGVNLSNDTYSFSLTLTRPDSGSLSISSSMIRATGGLNFAPVTNFIDTSPQTFTFNRIGFLSGSSIAADQIVLSNIAITVVPEPSSFAALAGLGALGFVASRRRRSVR